MRLTMNKKQIEQENNYNHEITIDRIACPLHVLQLKQGIKQVAQGETLKINSSAYVAPELLAAARQIGSSVSINANNEIFIIK